MVGLVSYGNSSSLGDNKLYTDMTFTMEDVNLNARWTGGAPNTTLPQTQGSPTAQITKDIQILVRHILFPALNVLVQNGLRFSHIVSNNYFGLSILLRIRFDFFCQDR